MFDFAWSEIAIIGVVALVLIGPKDMPVAVKGIADMVKKARRMAAEFQTHVDDMMKDTELKEVRDSLNQIRNFDIKGEIDRAVDADGAMRRAMTENPIGDLGIGTRILPETHGVPAATDSAGATALAEPGVEAAGLATAEEEPRPDFIPPDIAAPPKREERPAFIPPHYSDPREKRY